MTGRLRAIYIFLISILSLTLLETTNAQLPLRYATLELFTNTPCPICGSQNPGLFSRLENYQDQYHLISFFPGKPYTSCIFYQANTSENLARFNFYPGIAGTPTVVINGLELKSAGSVSNTVLDEITGGESWLSVDVNETTGANRTVNISLRDHVGGSLETGVLFTVIVEREILYNAPNGETLHHNVFRKFLTATGGDEVDLSSGMANLTYTYEVDSEWQEDETYVIAWLMDPETKEVYNSGTKYDPVIASSHELTRDLLHLYPNPASSRIWITTPENVNTAFLLIFDATGKLVYDEHVSDLSALEIDCSHWPAGNYSVTFKSEGRVWSGGFQVAR